MYYICICVYVQITRQVSSGSGGKDTSENIPKGTTVAVPAQKEGLGLGLGSKTTAPDGATNSVVASQGAVWVRGEAYFNMPPLVEEVIPGTMYAPLMCYHA